MPPSCFAPAGLFVCSYWQWLLRSGTSPTKAVYLNAQDIREDCCLRPLFAWLLGSIWLTIMCYGMLDKMPPSCSDPADSSFFVVAVSGWPLHHIRCWTRWAYLGLVQQGSCYDPWFPSICNLSTFGERC